MPPPNFNPPVQQQYFPIGIFNTRQPPKGAKAIAFPPINFTDTPAIELDLTLARQRGVIDFVQTLWIDNSQNNASIVVAASQGNTIEISAGWQGYIPVSVPNDPKFLVSSGGTGQAVIFAINVLVPALLWPTNLALNSNAQGQLLVSDPQLDSLYASDQCRSA